jgi:hypothetical protein
VEKNPVTLFPDNGLSGGGMMTKFPTQPGILLDFYGNPISGTSSANPDFLYAGAFGVVGDGVTDNSANLQTAVTQAISQNLGLILPVGQIGLASGVVTPQQSTGFFTLMGGGRGNTSLLALGNNDMMRFQMPSRAADLTVDHNGNTGNGLFFRTGYVGQNTTAAVCYGNAGQTGTGGVLCISLTAPLTVAQQNLCNLAGGCLIAMGGPGSGNNSAQPYVGTTAGTGTPLSGYSATGGPGGVPCIFILANTAFPTGLNVNTPIGSPQKSVLGTGLVPIEEFSALRIGCKNRGAADAGYSINFWDTSQNYPFQIQRAWAEDILIQNDASTLQEAVNFADDQSVHVNGILLDNSASTGQPRGPINVFGFDYASVNDVRAIFGVNGCSSDVANFGTNNGGASVCAVTGFEVVNPATTQAAQKSCLADSTYLTMRDVYFHVNASGVGPRLSLTPWSSAGIQHVELTDCYLDAGIQNNFGANGTLARFTMKGGRLAAGGSQGTSGLYTCKAGQNTGPLNFLDVEMEVTTTNGKIFSGATATVDAHILGGFFGATSGYVFTDGTLAGQSAVRGNEGLNPPLVANIPGAAFAMPASGFAWVNASGGDVTIFLISGSFTAVSVGTTPTTASLTGPWFVPAGSSWTPTYAVAPTVSVNYL